MVGKSYKQNCLSWLCTTLECPGIIKCFAIDYLMKKTLELKWYYGRQLIIMLRIETGLSLNIGHLKDISSCLQIHVTMPYSNLYPQ